MESGKVFSKEVIDVLILFANDSTIGPAGVQSDMCPRLSWVLHQMNPVKNESYSVFIEACINMIKEKGDALVIVNQKEETKQIKREDDLKVEK